MKLSMKYMNYTEETGNSATIYVGYNIILELLILFGKVMNKVENNKLILARGLARLISGEIEGK